LIRVALRGLAGRKLRAALTSIAIVLGVAMISGTLVLTDTIDRAFNTLFTESYANTDVVVSGKKADISVDGETPQGPPFPATILNRVKEVPDVEAAAGSISDFDSTKILDRRGKAINTQGAPSFGLGIDFSRPQFNPLRLVEGRWPNESDEAVIDAATAEKEKFRVGQTVRIATRKPVRAFKLVGIAQYGSVKSLGTATFAVFTIPTAQDLLDRKGQLDQIQAAGKPGVTPEKLAEELAAVVPANLVDVRTGEEQVTEDLKSVEFTKFIRYFLLAFAGIALFVGAFVIFNTLSITVAQRIREFATLRTIGASRRQLLTSVTLEALVIGVLASLVGLFGGLGLAAGLRALFRAINLDLPTTSLVFAGRTVFASLVVGIIVTLVAGLFPAIRATKVPPIAAVREGATLPPSRLAPFTPYIALVIVGLAVALLSYGMFVDDVGTAARLLSMAAGCLLLFIGVALVSSRVVPTLAVFVRPIAKWVMFVIGLLVYPVRLGTWLTRRALFRPGLSRGQRALGLIGAIVLLFAIGPALLLAVAFLLGLLASFMVYVGVAVIAVLEVVLLLWFVYMVVVAVAAKGWASDLPSVRFDPATDRLSAENSRRNPGRTAATAAALMIGLALVTFVAVLANGMKESNRGAIERQVKAEYTLTAQDGFTPFVAGAGDAVARSPVVEVASSVRSDLGKAAGESGYVTGIDPKTITSVYNFEWKDGSDAAVKSLGPFDAIVDKKFAEDENLELGSRFTLLTSNGKNTLLEVKGIYEAPPFYPLLGNVSILQSRFDQLYERPQNQFTFVDVKGPPDEAAETRLEAAVADFPDAKVQTRDGWIDQQDKDFNNFLIMLYVLLALSVIVSLFGMVNTLILSVFERTRELGMLRAVGMTRYQVSRMVRQESVITALIGATLGLPLGIFLAALVTRALSQFDVQFVAPWNSLILFALIAMIVGVVAAVAPARRAARLNVLRALQYE
jgi:ABC-type antimicrobial peptide transport system permease subunit